MNKRNVVNSAYLILTENCNLRCTYCFEGGSRKVENYMSQDIAFKTIDFLFKNVEEFNATLDNDKKKLDVHVTFFGGEPTLCTDLMIKIMEYAKHKQDETGIRFRPFIITNGTIYNEHVESFLNKWIELFGKESVYIQLSFDGIPEIQNKNRPCSNKCLVSSELIERTSKSYIDYYKKHGLNINRLTIHSCVSHDSLPYIYDSYLYFLNKLQIPNINFAWVMESNWDDNDLNIFSEQLRKVVQRVSERFNYLKAFPFKHFNDCNGCSSGKNMISIDTNGDIYPCHRFFFYKRDLTVIGNINNEIPIDENKKRMYEEFDTSSITNHPCQVCIALNYECTGTIEKLPNDWNIKFMEIINYYYGIYSGIIEKKALSNMLKNLNNRVTQLENEIKELKNK